MKLLKLILYGIVIIISPGFICFRIYSSALSLQYEHTRQPAGSGRSIRALIKRLCNFHDPPDIVCTTATRIHDLFGSHFADASTESETTIRSTGNRYFEKWRYSSEKPIAKLSAGYRNSVGPLLSKNSPIYRLLSKPVLLNSLSWKRNTQLFSQLLTDIARPPLPYCLPMVMIIFFSTNIGLQTQSKATEFLCIIQSPGLEFPSIAIA